MKKITTIFLSLFLLMNTSSASQLTKCNNVTRENFTQEAPFGNLITTLVNGLKPTAFSKDWKTQSASFLQKMKTQDAKDLTGSASALFELYKLLNPKTMSKEWKTEKGAFLHGVSEVKSKEDLSRLLLLLVNNISPTYFTKEFKAQLESFKKTIGSLGLN